MSKIKSALDLLEENNDILIVGNCANCGVEYHIHKQESTSNVDKTDDSNFFEKLKSKMASMSKEQLLQEWEKSKEFDSIGPTVTDFIQLTNDANSVTNQMVTKSEPLSNFQDNILDKAKKKLASIEKYYKGCKSEFGRIESIWGNIVQELNDCRTEEDERFWELVVDLYHKKYNNQEE